MVYVKKSIQSTNESRLLFVLDLREPEDVRAYNDIMACAQANQPYNSRHLITSIKCDENDGPLIKVFGKDLD